MTGERNRTDDVRDLETERLVGSWLRDLPDRPPDTLLPAAFGRSRATSQRAEWSARWHRRGGRSGSGLLVAGAGVAVVVAVVAFAVVGGLHVCERERVGTGPSPTPATSSAPAFDGRVGASIPLDEAPTALGSAFGSLWVGDQGGRLVRVDPVSGATLATIELDEIPCGPIVPAADSLWLASCGAGSTTTLASTVRVDPVTDDVVRFRDDAADGFGVGAMNGLVWFVSDVETGRLTAVDAASGARVRDLTVGVRIRHLAAGFGSLWVSPIGEPEVLRIDPDDGRELARIRLSGDAGFLTTGVDAIWVAEPHQWLIGRIDPVSDRVAAEIGAAPGVDHLAFADDGRLWALADDVALAVDPASGAILDRIPVPRHVAFDEVATHVLAVVDDAPWFADASSLVRFVTR
jgi:sugar lactone lactonase YvrE